MTENSIILKKLEQQDEKLMNIEKAVMKIAVQDEKIMTMENQINGLWGKYDAAFSPDGCIAKIKAFQLTCPKLEVKAAITRQWTAIGLIATMVMGVLLKVIKL